MLGFMKFMWCSFMHHRHWHILKREQGIHEYWCRRCKDIRYEDTREHY